MLKKKFPHTYVIVFFVILLAAITTWIVPAGEFNRQTIETNGNKRVLIQTDSYHQVDQQPQTWEIFSAFYKGFVRSPKIIVFILILGGAFWILNESKAIDAGVFAFLKRSKKLERYWVFKKLGVNNIIITLVMLMFSFFWGNIWYERRNHCLCHYICTLSRFYGLRFYSGCLHVLYWCRNWLCRLFCSTRSHWELLKKLQVFLYFRVLNIV